MVKIDKKIEALHQLGQQIKDKPPRLQVAAVRANWENPWFTQYDINYALTVIADQFLHKDKLKKFIQEYDKPDFTRNQKTVGLVMAGNVPLVGFHDLLMVLLAGHHAMVRQSSKDEKLLPVILEQLAGIDPELANSVQLVDKLSGFDAVIATGSNNTSRYFSFYFSRYPGIIRKNRNAAALLTGNETEADLRALGDDVFRYFGLGCRNVSKLYVPAGYDFRHLMDVMDAYKDIMVHEKYKHNYDYNKALLIMNEVPHMAREHFILVENEQLASPMATLYFSYYKSQEELREKLNQKREHIQALVSRDLLPEQTISFGQTQQPAIWDFPDDIDTFSFLLDLWNNEAKNEYLI